VKLATWVLLVLGLICLLWGLYLGSFGSNSYKGWIGFPDLDSSIYKDFQNEIVRVEGKLVRYDVLEVTNETADINSPIGTWGIQYDIWIKNGRDFKYGEMSELPRVIPLVVLISLSALLATTGIIYERIGWKSKVKL
jgi:hypothetical protein